MRSKLLLVFGTRPEAIKMAPLARALAVAPGFSVRICVTGQHRDMLTPVLRLFDLAPDIDLALMRAGQGLTELTAAGMLGVRDALRADRPDCVLVHGDTATTLAAALASFHERVPVAHIEAGLRTGDLAAPFPEEMNRQVTTRIARWHFAPTPGARDNLLREGVPPASVTVTGNTVVDAMQAIRARFDTDATLRAHTLSSLTAALGFDPASRPIVLVTGHRRENFGTGLQALCAALRELAARFPQTAFVYPLHLNPNVGPPVRAALGGIGNIRLIDPLDYAAFLHLMSLAHLVLTDSGGVQEEAPGLGVPVLLLRERTERPEGVEAGVVRMVGTDRQRIVDEAARLLQNPALRQTMTMAHNPYGDGRACRRIVAFLQAQRTAGALGTRP